MSNSREGRPRDQQKLISFFRSINVYSTQSVQPGWGSINLDKLVEHIHAENEVTEASNKARYERRLADGYYSKKE